MNIWGIKELTALLNKNGYKLAVRGTYYNVHCGNFTYTKKVDDGTYVFTDIDLKNALEYGKKHAKPSRK
ncbi:hypothetical protein NO1_1226 [Candidatus Termititenax aidoneus]|uniref:Uncharacterized protein n=1 Tax=Termititenax aidoneus TaxID=2218524 RepID=A0A388TBN2_TERA1|nr:hypothetical protein NO1_1226 [Candidatus Termititenax aidoneus]